MAMGKVKGGVNLDGYDNIKIQVDNSNLINVITHAPGYHLCHKVCRSFLPVILIK